MVCYRERHSKLFVETFWEMIMIKYGCDRKEEMEDRVKEISTHLVKTADESMEYEDLVDALRDLNREEKERLAEDISSKG